MNDNVSVLIHSPRLGEFVRASRHHLGWSQAALAERAGCAQTFLCNVENGRQPASVQLLEKLSLALGVNLDLLLFLAGRVSTELADSPIDPDVVIRMFQLLREKITSDRAAANLAGPVEEPAIGSVWMHRNGNLYRVLFLTNGSDRPATYPRTVVYEGENGARWSRPLADWHRSMTATDAAEWDPK